MALHCKITPIRIFILEVLAGAEEKVIVFQSMVVLAGEEEEKIFVFQPMVVLEQRVELLLFYYRGDCDDVYILSLFLYVYLFYDAGFVQIKKHRRIITLEQL